MKLQKNCFKQYDRNSKDAFNLKPIVSNRNFLCMYDCKMEHE